MQETAQDVEGKKGELSELIGWSHESDIIRTPAHNNKVVNFYTTLESFLAAQEEYIVNEEPPQVSDEPAFFRRFVEHGNVPVFNGDRVVFYCPQGRDTGELYLEGHDYRIMVTVFERYLIEYLIVKGIKIEIQEPSSD